MKRLLALFAAIAAKRLPAHDGHAACMALEREYAAQPYPFEWE